MLQEILLIINKGTKISPTQNALWTKESIPQQLCTLEVSTQNSKGCSWQRKRLKVCLYKNKSVCICNKYIYLHAHLYLSNWSTAENAAFEFTVNKHVKPNWLVHLPLSGVRTIYTPLPSDSHSSSTITKCLITHTQAFLSSAHFPHVYILSEVTYWGARECFPYSTFWEFLPPCNVLKNRALISSSASRNKIKVTNHI